MGKHISLLVFIICAICNLSASQDAGNHWKVIMKIVNHVEWPGENQPKTLVYGIIGSIDEYNAAWLHYSQTSSDGSAVIHLNDSEKLASCNVVYVSGEVDFDDEKILSVADNLPILIIAAKTGIQGSIISFVDRTNKIELEINEHEASIRGLKISDVLRSIASKIL